MIVHIIRIHPIRPARPRPQVGDRRMLRGREHVRMLARAKIGPEAYAYITRNGRPCFNWVPLEEAPDYLRDKPGRWIGRKAAA